MIAWPPAELLTDEYQLAMADSYLAQGLADEPVAFELFVRTLPPQRGFLVAAGLERVCEYLTGLAFGADALGYLRRSHTCSEPLLRHLGRAALHGRRRRRARRARSCTPASRSCASRAGGWPASSPRRSC